jgi:gamma-glutamylcysteine synthetase
MQREEQWEVAAEILAAAADEQKIVIVDLQKQLVQVQSKIGLMQRARTKAGEADDDIAAQTSQLLARTRMAADKSTALFSDLEGDMP